jgi:hypothetical protein
MEQFYVEQVYDYGDVLKDLVAKKKPNSLAGTPNLVSLNPDNFKVVQINRHLTDSPDANLVKNKHNYSVTLKNEIRQIQEAIEDRNKKIKVTKFTSVAERKKFELEIESLIQKDLQNQNSTHQQFKKLLIFPDRTKQKQNQSSDLEGFGIYQKRLLQEAQLHKK